MSLSFVGLLGAELFLILTLLALAWGFLSWRKRRQRDRSLEEMVGLLEQNAAERGLHYSQWLKSHQSLNEEDAQTIATQWLEAEKRFWQVFVTWHLHPDPKTLPDFPHQLQRLFNSRLEILAKALAPREDPLDPPTHSLSMDSTAESPSEPKQSLPVDNLDLENQSREATLEMDQEEDGILVYSDQTNDPQVLSAQGTPRSPEKESLENDISVVIPEEEGGEETQTKSATHGPNRTNPSDRTP